MNLEKYLELVRRYPEGDSKHLNLQSNFQIGLGMDHKDFCDSMISSSNFSYQDYAPKYNHRDSYLIWHEGVLELRVWNGVVRHLTILPKEFQKRFRITVQTNHSEDKVSLELPVDERIRNMKEVILYLIDTSAKNQVPIGIQDIYYNHPSGQESMLWLPE